MIVRKASAVGTLYEQVLEMRTRQLADVLMFESFIKQPRLGRCRIKSPVPHPLSLAVMAAITRSIK